MREVYALITKMDAEAYRTKDTLALEIERA